MEIKHNIYRKGRYFIAVLLGLLVSVGSYGQGLTLFELDSADYPTMRAKFFAVDATGNPLLNLSPSSMSISENDGQMVVNSVSCPTFGTHEEMSSVLVSDASAAMSAAYQQFATAGIQAWLQAMPLGSSECALTAFNIRNQIIQDFTRDRDLLLAQSGAIFAAGATDYNAGLIEPMAGALHITENAKRKPVIVLFIAGYAFPDANVSSIIEEAKRQNARIYCITTHEKCPESLQEIALQTGGYCIANINSKNKAVAAYHTILRLAQGAELCDIEWKSSSCGILKNTLITSQSPETSANFSYSIDPNILPYCEISKEASLAFGGLTAGTKDSLTIDITARIGSIEVNSIITSNNKFQVVDYGGNAPPFTLQANDTRTLTIEFAPTDSLPEYSRFDLQTNGCDSSAFHCTGGFGKFADSNTTLNLIHPDGAEALVVGAETNITWEGMLPNDTLKLQFSSDNGKNWSMLNPAATNLQEPWTPLLSQTSDECLMRLYNVPNNSEADSLISSLMTSTSYGKCTMAYSPDGDKVALDSSGGYIMTYNIKTRKKEKRLKCLTATSHCNDWSPDGVHVAFGSDAGLVFIWNTETNVISQTFKIRGQQIPSIKYNSDGSKLAICDIDSNLVDIWDIKTGSIIKSFSHTDVMDAKWSADDTKILINGYNSNLTIVDFETGTVLVEFGGGGARTEWSPDEKKVVARIRKIINHNALYYVCVWDSETGELLIEHQVDSEVDSGQCALDWIPGTSIFAVTIEQNKVSFIDANTNLIVKELYYEEDVQKDAIYEPFMLKISPDATYLAMSGHLLKNIYSKDGTIFIWNLAEIQSNISISDTTFSVVRPEATSMDIDMGSVLLGASKDSVLHTFITNPGLYKIRIDSIAITGANPEIFSILDYEYPFYLNADENKEMTFRFIPSKAQEYTANIQIYTQIDTLSHTISGTGLAPVLEVLSKWIDVGSVKVGQFKDSVAVLAVKNVSNNPLTIANIQMGNSTDSDFSILTEQAGLILQAGDTAYLDIRFTPSSPGRITETVEFDYDGVGSPTIISLMGEGLQAKALLINPLIDFGEREIRKEHDTLFVPTIMNDGNLSLNVIEAKCISTPDSTFFLLSSQVPISVLPGDTLRNDLSFTTDNLGTVNGTLELYYEDSTLPAVIALSGTGIFSGFADVSFKLDSLSGFPGDTIYLPLILTEENDLGLVVASGFKTELQFNPSLLFPMDYSINIIDQTTASITLDNLPADIKIGDTLAIVRFQVALGNSESCDFVLNNSEALDANINITAHKGYFKLLGLCYEGGTRLYQRDMQPGIINISPNPGANIITIYLNLIEKGYTEVAIYDLLGKKIKTVFAEDVNQYGSKKLSVDLTATGQGQYMFRFQTPTYLQTKPLILVK